MSDMEKWFGRQDATYLLHDASLDSSVNEAFLQRQRIMTWDKCGGSRFIHYITHVAPNYKTIFFAEQGSCTHRYMLEPIPISAIQTIASMRLSSHHVSHMHCYVRRGIGAHVMKVVDYAHFAPYKFE